MKSLLGSGKKRMVWKKKKRGIPLCTILQQITVLKLHVSQPDGLCTTTFQAEKFQNRGCCSSSSRFWPGRGFPTGSGGGQGALSTFCSWVEGARWALWVQVRRQAFPWGYQSLPGWWLRPPFPAPLHSLSQSRAGRTPALGPPSVALGSFSQTFHTSKVGEAAECGLTVHSEGERHNVPSP